MKNYIYTTIAILFCALIATCFWLGIRNQYLKTERDIFGQNQKTLINGMKKEYKTKDSLNAITNGILILENSDFRKYRAEDARIIGTLETKNRELQSVTTTQSVTINNLRGNVRDSIVYVPIPGKPNTEIKYKTDTLRCMNILEPWFELRGCTDKNGIFTGKHISRDSLLITVTVERKRFLGFLWKTNKIKNRKVDAVSKNPATKLEGIEFIEIRK